MKAGTKCDCNPSHERKTFTVVLVVRADADDFDRHRIENKLYELYNEGDVCQIVRCTVTEVSK